MKILIADDDRVLNHLLSTVFRRKGWTVTNAFDAMQALMTAMRAPVDVIVMDIDMPGGTGIEALKKLKVSSKTAQIPVLILSGSIDPSASDSIIELGAEEFLPKPTEPEVVYETVLRLVKAAQG